MTPSKRSVGKKGKYGYTEGCKTDLFCNMIEKKPMTMKEVEATGIGPHPKAFKKLRNEGKADRDIKGRMYIIGSPAEDIVKSEGTQQKD